MNRYIEKGKAKEKEKRINALANKHINLGIIVYFLIFAYLIFCVITFSFSEKTNYTLAEPGIIIDAQSFTGLVIKDELVVTSNISGNTNYFIPEGEKIKQGTLISMVDQSGHLSNDIKSQLVVAATGNNEDEIKISKIIQDKLNEYVLNKYQQPFSEVYSKKVAIEKTMNDYSNTISLDENKSLKSMIENSAELSKDVNLYYAPKSGVISYSFDGFESLSIDNFEPEYLNQALISIDTLDKTSILKGGQLFKVVDNYKWYIAARIDGICEKHLEGRDNVSIDVEGKNISIKGYIYKIMHQDSNTYLILEFDRLLNDFLDDRFIDFTINYFNSQGIKIPKSAVTTKNFLKIPLEALETSNDEILVKKKIIDEKNVAGESLLAIPVYMYYIENDEAYIPETNQLKKGDTISYILDDGKTNMSYKIIEQKPIEGVYVINKGYAAFKIIETLSSTKDYRIIKESTPYGVRKYDRIATNASLLKEDEVIK